ncbi:hypothetical protein MPF_1811 [Methanohalophilus portucalensis FDF-1]|uniref:Uncharacterized protein n=2 Tax=Methanohalophilus portucalensis FDF-1 TaxID=523843 RepID=A0A1L9C2J6_9EURY|nr:hypothetical protein MPF_1811 [Methanohalophilus portucalensis FDF-1]
MICKMQKWVLKINNEITFENRFSDKSIENSKLAALLSYFCNEVNVEYILLIGDWIDD